MRRMSDPDPRARRAPHARLAGPLRSKVSDERRLLLAGVLAPLLLTALIALWVFAGDSSRFDDRTLLWWDHHSPEPVDDAMVWISHWSLIAMPPALAGLAVVALFARRIREAVLLLVAYPGAAVISATLKDFTGRERPDVFAHLIDLPLNYSFPSGHALMAMCFATTLVFTTWPLRRVRRVLVPAAVAYALWVGISRLVLGVHYPTDVLAGWLLAIAWVCLLSVTLGLPVRAPGVGAEADAARRARV